MSALFEFSLFRRLFHGVITKPWSIAAGPLTLGMLLDTLHSRQRQVGNKAIDIFSEVRLRELGAAKHYTYSIVTPDENNPAKGRLSCCSPLGFALLGKRKGEQVTVKALFRNRRFVVDKVICRNEGKGVARA